MKFFGLSAPFRSCTSFLVEEACARVRCRGHSVATYMAKEYFRSLGEPVIIKQMKTARVEMKNPDFIVDNTLLNCDYVPMHNCANSETYNVTAIGHFRREKCGTVADNFHNSLPSEEWNIQIGDSVLIHPIIVSRASAYNVHVYRDHRRLPNLCI